MTARRTARRYPAEALPDGQCPTARMLPGCCPNTARICPRDLLPGCPGTPVPGSPGSPISGRCRTAPAETPRTTTTANPQRPDRPERPRDPEQTTTPERPPHTRQLDPK